MKLLPFDYAFRNVGRRPVRSLVAALSSALVAGVLVAAVSFVRGLERSQIGSAPARTAIVLSSASMRDVVRSAIAPAVGDLLAAEAPGIVRVDGVPAVSSEIHMASNVRVGDDGIARPGFLRGVTERAFLVHDAVTVVEGRPFGSGEVLVGRLAAEKMGLDRDALQVGTRLHFETGVFTVSGVFAAPGTALEGEIWVPLHELKGLVRRDDVSAVFARTVTEDDFVEIDLFTKRRLDLELLYIPAATYYRELAGYFAPIRGLVWMMAGLIALAAVFSGANTIHAAVQDRIRELATLRALGYGALALAVSLLQGSLLFAAAGCLVGLVAARAALAGGSVSLAMSAFSLDVGPEAVLVAFGGALAFAVVGTLPALYRAVSLPVAAALKED